MGRPLVSVSVSVAVSVAVADPVAAPASVAIAAPAAAARARKPVPGTYTIREAELVYQVRHPLHGVTGVSREVRGTLEVQPTPPWVRLPARLAAPLAAFTSRNRNRDNNALAALEARRYPEAEVRILGLRLHPDGGGQWQAAGSATGDLTLRGMTRPFEAQIEAALTDSGELAIDARFEFSLTAHRVERPLLLLMPIDDAVTVRANLVAVP